MTWLELLTVFVAGAGFGYRICLARQRDNRRRHQQANPILLRPYVPSRTVISPHASTTAPTHDRSD